MTASAGHIQRIIAFLLVLCLAFTPAMPGIAWAIDDAPSSSSQSESEGPEAKSEKQDEPQEPVATDETPQKDTPASPPADSPVETPTDSEPEAENPAPDNDAAPPKAEESADSTSTETEESAEAARVDKDAAIVPAEPSESVQAEVESGNADAERASEVARIGSVRFSFQRVAVASDGALKPLGDVIACDGKNVPAITAFKGSIVLKAEISFEDAEGKTRICDGADAEAKLTWEIVGVDIDNGSSAKAIARTKPANNGSNMQDCLVSALGTGNGTVKVRCTSDAYPKWSGKLLTVQVSDNAAKVLNASKGAPAPEQEMTLQASGDATPVSATLLYRNSLTGMYEAFPGTAPPNNPARVVVSSNEATFDVQIEYSDGTTARASDIGVPVSWSLSNNVHAGQTVASIDSSGRLSLSGVSSKLVQLNAKVEGLDVARCPAYVNLVCDVEQPSAGKAISSMSIDFSSVEVGENGTYDVSASTELEIPKIIQAEGKLLFTSTVRYIDSSGAQSEATGASANANLVWQLVAFYDALGVRSDVLAASAQTTSNQSGVLSALRSGNGWAILRCVSLEYPDFAGQEVLVRIENNEAVDPSVVAANTVTGAQLVYKDEETGAYLTYNGFTRFNTPTIIDEPYGSVSFDVRLAFQDGSTALAGERGIAVDWRLAGVIDSQRNIPIAQMAADGTLSATRVKNSVVSITRATVNGRTVDGTTAYVRITNNGFTMPLDGGLVMSGLSSYWLRPNQSPDDASQNWRWSPTPTGPNATFTVPLCVTNMASRSWCALTAGVAWDDGTLTTNDAQDHAERTWSILSSTDLEGRHTSGLVSLVDGFVSPTGKGSGYVTIRCDARVPYYDADGKKQFKQLSGLCKVAVYASQSYVEKVEILDEKGNVAQSSILLPKGKNVYAFSARITYREFDGASGSMKKREVVVPQEIVAIEGLEWSVYRSEERAERDLYSLIRQNGSFLAQSGFSRAYVYVNLKGASFTGADIGAGVTVIAEDSVDPLGQVDSMKVVIFHHSDYAKEGKNAPVAKELTLSRAQLEARADYTTWYTFQRRSDSFATIYAHGVTMQSLLALCGVPENALESMVFTGNDGVTGIVHSADFILGSQYRYTNYYYHKSMPGLVHGQPVAPMLALSYYLKNNAGYEDKSDTNNAGDAGFGMMGTDSTFRVIFGMRGVNVNNANQSIYKVTRIVMVVADNTFPPEDEAEEEEKPDPKDDSQEESGDTDPSQGDSPKEDSEGAPGGKKKSNNPFDGNSDEGAGNDKRQGGDTALNEQGEPALGKEDGKNDENDDEGASHGEAAVEGEDMQETDEDAHSAFARELKETPQVVVPPAKIAPIWWIVTIVASLLALILGALTARRRFLVDRARGAFIHT